MGVLGVGGGVDGRGGDAELCDQHQACHQRKGGWVAAGRTRGGWRERGSQRAGLGSPEALPLTSLAI